MVLLIIDHYHYSRWLNVHLFDLANIMTDHPDVYEQFCKGFFAFNKTSSEFSAMALDQVHEQNNELIKGTGGATRLLNREDDSSLHRWELCGSELSNILSSFEDSKNRQSSSSERPTYKKHHEDTESFKERFAEDVQKLSEAFAVNPFSSDSFTAVNNTNIVFTDEISNTIKIIDELGENQFLK